MVAVDGISFEVEAGEVFGFLGPNGAGKTTTIRILTGLSRPTAGGARVLGYNILTEITKAKKVFGVVPELSNMYDELSGLWRKGNWYWKTGTTSGIWSRGLRNRLVKSEPHFSML